ncbi:MAG: citramalate synthase [Chloroflexi bacterium]|nr:citramalate synthase [Chloroflexota bacterium]
MKVVLYDTTLRDGAQMEGISYSVEEKLEITRRLDELGVHYIEGGWPGSNPKDAEYFRRVRDVPLRQATIAAFSSTRRAHTAVTEDPNILALLESGAPVCTLVAKTWDLHVHRVLNTTLEENLAMIRDSVRYLREQGRRVFLDAEHFFDGFKANPRYALRCVQAAVDAGAECVVLCDTNGGAMTTELVETIRRVQAATAIELGIHVHDDCDLAVANSLAALEAGAVQVQGTLNGYGERCGNANLCTIIALLKLKLGVDCVTDQQLARLTELSHYGSELANLRPDPRQPFVGINAFTHKAGLHADAVGKVEESYQHVPPERVGNHKRVLVSELAGRANIVQKSQELGLGLEARDPRVRQVLQRVKEMESRGYQYEGAEASFELLVRRMEEGYQPPFELVDFLVVVEKHRRAPTSGNGEEVLSEATVKVRVGDEAVHTASEGNGPVNALDGALRKALTQFYPSLAAVKLVDYKVRILEGTEGTEAQVRVLIESSDGEQDWRTVGSSTNIIEASWYALVDSLEYWLVRKGLVGRAVSPGRG